MNDKGQIVTSLDELKSMQGLKEKDKLLDFLSRRDGAAILVKELPKIFSPNNISIETREQRAWELIGLFYQNQNRFYEALSIFTVLYNHMLAAQTNGVRCHKGMPLVWMSDCYSRIGFPALAKRYLMLTLCEDAIREKGIISPETTGIYFRLVWGHGLLDSELKKYAGEIYDLHKKNPASSIFPEWILQDLDQNWMTEFPAPKEAVVYSINTIYVQYLMSKLGEKSGKILERLAEYVLSCMPGCKTARRKWSRSTDYDIVCSIEGFEMDFRSELGRYFVCECKDWDRPADFTTMAKFCRVLDSIKSRFGILFSESGISGEGETIYAEGEQLKVFQDRGMVIVVINHNDLQKVADGSNFINLLRSKYEKVRLDLK